MVLVALVLSKVVHVETNKRSVAFFFLLLIIGTFIPVLGLCMVVVFVLLLRHYSVDFNPVELNTFAQVEYTRKNPVNIVAYGSGWASTRLQSSNFSTDQRKQALQGITRGTPKDSNLIYNQLVSDDVEELRVCAFSMLENQQNYIHEKINQLLKTYNEMTDVNKKAFMAKQLALLYWELIYRNLSDYEFRKLLLERSTFFANIALAVFKEDATLWILLSRIEITKGEKQKGLTNLEIAAKYNAPKSKVLPFLAELAYQKHDYNGVKRFLGEDSSMRFILKINKVIRFWCPYE